jgi:pyruvate ferredoxin oxidoreductase gamma subunit
LPEDGTLIVNSSMKAQETRKQLKLKGRKIFTVDASKISKEAIGREIPNTPMLGALVKVSNIIKFEDMIKDLESKLEKKFAHKPEVVKGNLEAVKRAYQEVTGE